MSDSGERRGGNKKIISILALKGTYKAALCKERLMQLLTTSIKLAENILGVNRIKAVSRHIAVLFLWSNCIRDFIYLFFNCRDHILCGRFSAYILSPPQRTRTAAVMAQTGVAVIHYSIYCCKFNNSEYTTIVTSIEGYNHQKVRRPPKYNQNFPPKFPSASTPL